MSAARPDPLARWRAARAAQCTGTVATVATSGNAVATPGEARKSADVATVATVATQNSNERVAQGERDAWGLSEADKAEVLTPISPQLELDSSRPPLPTRVPDVRGISCPRALPMEHDAAERAAMAAHYAEPPAAPAYVPESPDPFRDGLLRGFHSHRAAWEALPCGAERGRAFAEVRREPGACPNCAGRRWWREAGEPDTAQRCATCHPPIHLRPESIHEVNT